MSDASSETRRTWAALPLGPLREPRFRVFYIGQICSDVGSALATVALAFAVLGVRGSASDLAWVMAGRVAPMLVVTIVGGVWIDRLSRERVLVFTRTISGVSQGLAALLLLTGTPNILLLTVLSFVTGSATILWVPAAHAVMPGLVPAEKLREANALSRLTTNTITIAGSAAGGLLASVINPSWILAIDAATFFVSAAVLLLLPPNRAHTANRQRRHFWRELREGWSVFTSLDWLWPVVLQFAIINAAWSGAYTLIGPVVALERLGGPAAWGSILAASAIGTVCGGLIALRFRPRHPMRAGVLCVLALAGPLLAIAAGGNTWTIALIALAASVFMEIFEVQYAVSMQRHVRQDAMARVSAYDGLVSFGAVPLGYAVSGPLVAHFGVSWTAGGAAVCIVVATLLALAAPGVWRLTDSPEPEDERTREVPTA